MKCGAFSFICSDNFIKKNSAEVRYLVERPLYVQQSSLYAVETTLYAVSITLPAVVSLL